MRAGGINWAAVLVAGIAFYAIGFVIYGLLIPPERWMAMSGISAADMEAVGQSRMPFSVVMPLMTAGFMALLFKWGSVTGVSKGAQWGAVVALASAVPGMLYGWVYGVGPIDMTLVDSAHLLLGHVTVGMILGAWK
ncbi:DUF1761 domain-containing protein [Sphingomonas sp.]|uniref:DUF1761 domain-containing protein n=1 Tax=Sphingomonas sp. TaxID=28214 RepID=UPI00286A0C8E|nr:DUF1761 domain-containing protein [Sphingomonas sp.]